MLITLKLVVIKRSQKVPYDQTNFSLPLRLTPIMILDEALKVADEVLFSHTGKHLTDIQQMILQKSWDDKGYEEMLDEGWALPTIRKAGNKLWNLLSEALGEKVSKTSFKGALEKRWKLVQHTDIAITSPILDVSISKDELEEILRLFSKRDSAVLKNDKKEFLTTQLNEREIRGGASTGYIKCSKMITSILRIGRRFSQTMLDTCSPSPLDDDDEVEIQATVYVVNVKEKYEHNNTYSHSGYISYFLTRTHGGLKIKYLKSMQESQLQDAV